MRPPRRPICAPEQRTGGWILLSVDESPAGHRRGLRKTEKLQHRRGDVGDAPSLMESIAFVSLAHVEEWNAVESVLRERRSRHGIDHLLAVSMVGGDEQCAVSGEGGIDDAADAYVDGLD